MSKRHEDWVYCAAMDEPCAPVGEYLPEDVRECCEVLRDWGPGLGELDRTPSVTELEAATWQVLEYLGVL